MTNLCKDIVERVFSYSFFLDFLQSQPRSADLGQRIFIDFTKAMHFCTSLELVPGILLFSVLLFCFLRCTTVDP